TLFPYTTLFRSLQTCALVVAQVIAECATDSPVWIIACTIQSLQSRVYGRTSVGARLNATTGKPRFRGAAQPARARWSTPRRSSQHADQQPKPGTDFRLARDERLDRLEVLEHRRALVVAQVIAEGVTTVVVAEDRGVVEVLGLADRRVGLAVIELLPDPAERVPVVVLTVVVLAPPVARPLARVEHQLEGRHRDVVEERRGRPDAVERRRGVADERLLDDQLGDGAVERLVVPVDQRRDLLGRRVTEQRIGADDLERDQQVGEGLLVGIDVVGAVAA